MSALAPELLLQTWLAGTGNSGDSAVFGEPFHVPYDRLARVDGWTLWLGHPPIPEGLPLLPAPETLVWGEPLTAITTAMLVSADYAVRRGASDAASARALLEREAPVAIVIPGPLIASLEPSLARAEEAGVPVVRGEIESADELAAMFDSFGMRRTAHAVDLGRAHDPALTFQTHVPEVTIGGNSLSSFVVRNKPERDGVTVTGELTERVGIEIGLSGPAITIETTRAIETLASTIPSFLDRITSTPSGDSLSIGWRNGDAPDPRCLGEAFRVWLKALTGATLVDVRIAFAPDKARSPLLSEMQARASAFHELRDAQIAGDMDTLAEVAAHLRANSD
jgi:hypothetical protein